MKFVVIFKEFVFVSLMFFLSIVKITNVKLDKNDQTKERLEIPVTPKKSAFENNILKNIDFVAISKDRKFSISKNDYQVIYL